MRRATAAVLGAVVAFATLALGAPFAAAADPCAGLSPVACENLKPGNPSSEWDDFDGAGDDTLQGFATSISVNQGQHLDFKIKTDASAYRITIYRLGWYQGNGARKIASLAPSAPLPQVQPACLADASTGLVDCGNWAVSAGWDVPADAVSGVYIAHLQRTDTGGSSHIPFIVRDDSSHSDVVFQTSDTTWQAYNTYGGSSFYESPTEVAAGAARGLKLSYNRPFATRGGSTAHDYLMSMEYPMIRFLERNGYDLSYISGVDTDRSGTLLTNHKAFLSVGHDEYWSGTQRANVEAARDAGVNLAFFSGNEVYWKTRWEPSIDGTGTDHRTLVCYKETWSNAKIDPSSEWTGTWRDPRFSTDGGRPENALTGTAYMSNDTDLTMTVTAAEGKQRLWRNTAASTLSSGSYALAPDTVGYESDEDLDNGFRPAGLIRLSTTTGASPQYLRDFGNTTSVGSTTHHMTMYKAPSGALVFAAGTIQWSFGLDANHDVAGGAESTAMQQATVNLLADMHAQPTTRMSGLVSATASVDTTSPVVTVTSPVSGALPSGSQITVTGTASDSGGVVAGVEVSLDAGLTWHPASGTTSWTYTGIVSGASGSPIKVRASDDSLNLSTPFVPSASVSCPCSVFGNRTPTTVDSNDASAVELGMRFNSATSGWVTGVRFYKSAANTGTHTGTLWSSAGAQLATGTFIAETASGWQTLQFPAPVAIDANTTYVVSYFAPSGRYSVGAGADADSFWLTDKVSTPLRAPKATPTTGTGVYAGGHAFPTQTYNGANYYVDVLFNDTDILPPSVVSTTPPADASSVDPAVRPKVVLSEDIQAGSLGLTATAAGAAISGSSSYDAATRTATFTPAATLPPSTLVTLSITATDLAGNASAATTVSFRTADPSQQPGVCPCAVWNDIDAPSTVAYPDPSANELGMRFTTQVDGLVTGVRFYKGPGNTGTHTGSLWTSAGTLLSTATFAGESSQGWQSVTFGAPVAVSAGVTYVVSYFAPQGRYAVNPEGFGASGLTVPPLVIPAGAAAYRAGSAGFPADGSSVNYWVQPVFTVPADVKPTVSTLIPAAATTNVRADAVVSSTFGTLVQPGSAVIELRGPGGTIVAGQLTWDSLSRTARFTPAASLLQGSSYQVTVSGARSLSGTPMDPVTASFTTAGVTACPCTTLSSTAVPTLVDSADSGAISLGLRFVADANGQITGVRFYKAAANTGTHSGSLWSASGQRLATGTFTGETADGWQTLTFAQAVDVVAGQTYIASYYTPTGHYSVELDAVTTGWTNGPLTVPGGANGVYGYGGDIFPTGSYRSANYFVDPIFTTGAAADATPPGVSAAAPIDGASSVPTSATPSAQFSEQIAPATLSMTVVRPDHTTVSGTTAYDSATKTATFTPSAPLDRGVTYAVSVMAADVAGNPMAAPSTWSFTTMLPSPAPGVCPCAVWDDAAVPATINDPDSARVEVGAAFTVDVPELAAGVRFYKGTNNAGPHTVSLWSDSGALLAQGTTTTESATGWQYAAFSSPVTLAPGSSYVVSYLAASGGYSSTVGGLAAPVDAPPLHVPASGGRYVYGGGFPANTSTANYWVTPVVDAAPIISDVSATAGPGSLTVTWTTDRPATSTVNYGTTAALGQSVAGADGLSISHTVTVTGLASATTYYVGVTSSVASGLSASAPAVPGTVTTPDTVAPVVSAVTATPSAGQVTITWTTDESATSVVGYGTTAALGSTASGATGTTHSVTITGLGSATTYSYAVTSADAAGNTTTSALATFTTPDTVAPVVTAIVATPGPNRVTITWTTDESASSVVDYGATAALGNTATGATGTSHSVTISGLGSQVTYSYAVTSADAAGNSTTSAVATFTTPDSVPPVISAVTSTPGSTTAPSTTATIAWTTNESSTSRVDYGTSPTSLTLSATGAAGTSHAVGLTGLTVNTRYYYRVTSADPTGNTTTSPATTQAAAIYAPPTFPTVFDTTAELATGTVASATVTTYGAGTVTLAPAYLNELNGTTLGTGLSSTLLVTGGTTAVTGGLATLTGTRVLNSTGYGSAGSVTWTGTLLTSDQRVGFMATNGFTDLAYFTRNASGQLVATANDGLFNNSSIVITAAIAAGPHEYRVDYTTTIATYFVDGVQVATRNYRPTDTLFAFAQDSDRTNGGLAVDWVRVGAYAASGTYTSRVVDAGASVVWDGVAALSTVPTGTTLSVSVRSGNTATPGTGWTAWATVPPSGGVSQTGRYVQFQVTMTSTGTRYLSPTVSKVTLKYHLV